MSLDEIIVNITEEPIVFNLSISEGGPSDDVVKLTGDQTVAGLKTFSNGISVGENSQLQGLSVSYSLKSADYLATPSDCIIDCINSLTITLPNSPAGKIYNIKNSGTGIISISGQIDGSTSTKLSNQYESITLASNGSDWIII